MKNFWQTIEKPIIALAPMANVTDAAFRRLFAKYGKPDVIWTEFVAADGLVMAPDNNHAKNKSGLSSKEILLKDLEYTEAERPIVAQLFSSKPEYVEQAAQLVQDLGFDGVDINMGCPVKVIGRQGCGAAMIKNPENAAAVIGAVKKGAPNIPVSVKTRIGYNKIDEFEEWISFLLKQNIACLTIHWRTQKEMSKPAAHWELAQRAVELRNEIAPDTVLLGNGDVTDLEDARKKMEETGVDGVMIGRGIFGNPWFFSGKAASTEEKLKTMLEHTKLFEQLLPHKSFSVMKKHYKAYVEGFDGAKELRIALMETSNLEGAEALVHNFLAKREKEGAESKLLNFA